MLQSSCTHFLIDTPASNLVIYKNYPTIVFRRSNLHVPIIHIAVRSTTPRIKVLLMKVQVKIMTMRALKRSDIHLIRPIGFSPACFVVYIRISIPYTQISKALLCLLEAYCRTLGNGAEQIE